jgi:4-hydroxy-4-methyl-2-oxoglutarate aldolase
MSFREHDPATTARLDIDRVSVAVVAAARMLPTATLHEAGGKIGALPSIIKPVAAAFRCCGPALTVHSPGGDNLWLHRALDIAQPGDVLVVHVSGAYEHGYWGEIMTTMAKARGLAGLVIDGCVRDGVLLEQIGFPVFARGLCIRGTGKDYGATGWLNAPVLIGDVTVSAGDLVVGDADGVVAVPRLRAAEVVAKSQQRERDEAAILKRLQDGESTMQVYGFH